MDKPERYFVLKEWDGGPGGWTVTLSELKRRLSYITGWPLEELGTLEGEIHVLLHGDLGEEKDPCYICKKMLINCGLDRVVCSTADGGAIVFRIEEWIRDWQERDILDDEHQYGKDQ
jgi:hypothetical protein